eukprot:scaffold2910_cov390-Prasinococcus_capsulatus_cf.AAC.63
MLDPIAAKGRATSSWRTAWGRALSRPPPSVPAPSVCARAPGRAGERGCYAGRKAAEGWPLPGQASA